MKQRQQFLVLARVLVAGQCLSAVAADGVSKTGTLIEKLGDQNVVIARRSAAEALGQEGEAAAKAVPALLKALRSDPDPIVRHQAAWALGKIKIPTDETVPGLVTALGDADWAVRHNATLSLTWIGKPAIEPLKARLDDESAVKRVHSLHTLLVIDPTMAADAMPKLLELLQHENEGVRDRAAAAAGTAGQAAKAAVPGLMAMLDEKDPDMRKRAIGSLGKIGNPAVAAVPKLIHVLKADKEKWNRIEAALVLGSVGREQPEVIRALTAALDDKDSRVRAYAATAMGQIGEPAVPALEAALKSNDPRLRALAANALGSMRGQARVAVSSLVTRLDDPDLLVRTAAADALGLIGFSSKEVKEALERSRDAESPNTLLRAHFEQALSMLTGSQQAGQ